MRLRGVIFDLDGTLVNSLEDIADSMNSVLREHGFPTHGLMEYKAFVGRGMRNLVVRSLPEDARGETRIALCRDSLLKEYGMNCLKKTRAYEGITDLLEGLDKGKMERAVFSNKIDHLTKRIVEALFPGRRFPVVVGAGAGMPEKPDPTGVLSVARQLGIEPERLIYVGDSDVDMETAHNAGMYPAGALWGFRTEEELVAHGAKSLLGHPLDLLRIINEENRT
ncbi:MAG: Phosphoglycolate phosphatase [Syntrophorhabdus sp. PtaB.Bin184]|nr:MAG: Phosphoglycolate phosphatase [Syntrophorhabdus sp. PtaB.Bin184]